MNSIEGCVDDCYSHNLFISPNNSLCTLDCDYEHVIHTGNEY